MGDQRLAGRAEPDVFRFDDEQLICRIEPPTGVPITGASIWNLEFEIQVKTVSQYAWGTATHGYVYKGDTFDWRRERLSAQLRALAEQADLLYAEFLQVSDAITPGVSRRTTELTCVSKYLTSWIRRGWVLGALVPASPVRFAKSVVDLCTVARVPVAAICRVVSRYLRTRGQPLSISLFQLVAGIALTSVSGGPPWSRLEGRFTLFATSELLDLFPQLASIPPAARVT